MYFCFKLVRTELYHNKHLVENIYCLGEIDAYSGVTFHRRLASRWVHCASSAIYQVTDPEPEP